MISITQGKAKEHDEPKLTNPVGKDQRRDTGIESGQNQMVISKPSLEVAY